MRLTYNGNHSFTLCISPGNFQSWKQGETHPIDEKYWERAKLRPDIAILITNGMIKEVGDHAQKMPVTQARVESPVVPRPPEPVKAPEPESLQSFESGFGKLNYRTAIKKLEDVSDPILLRRLLSNESRGSVKKVLEAKIETLSSNPSND